MIQSSYSFMWDHSDWNTLMKLSEPSSHFPFSLSIASESRFAIRGRREDEEALKMNPGWVQGMNLRIHQARMWGWDDHRGSVSSLHSIPAVPNALLFQGAQPECWLSNSHRIRELMSQAGPGYTTIIQCQPHTSSRLGGRETPGMGKEESPEVHLYAAIAKYSCSNSK